MDLDPARLSMSERYKLLIGGIVPRPIAFVSSVSPDGKTNLAPFSFFNGVSSNPMTLMFCPANNADGSEKDTLRNVRTPEEGGTGQFVVNAAVESYERKVALAAEPLAHGDSEFALTGLTEAPSAKVRAPRVAESPLCYECETERVISLAPGEPGGGNLVLGRVVHVCAADGLVNERMHVDADTLGAIGRLGGTAYCRTSERFDMRMGRG